MYTETVLYFNNNIKIKIRNNYLPLSLFELVEFDVTGCNMATVCNCGVASISFEVDGSTMSTETVKYFNNNNIKISIGNN
jgi:hypothetical protein